MVELILLACLAVAPDRCEEFRVPFETGNMMACVWHSPMLTAQWTSEHPTWRVKRATCGLPRA